MRRLAIIAALVLSMAGLGASPYFVGTTPDRRSPHLSGDAVSGVADTFRLLVRDADLPNADAVTNGWVLADSFYTQINDSTANEEFMRYGGIDLTNSTGPLYFDTGGYSRRWSTSSEYDQVPPQYWMFIAFNVSGLDPGDKVEDAHLIVRTVGAQTYDGDGYLAARLDTVVADYEMLNSVSTRTDPSYLEISSTKSNLTDGTDWVVLPENRDDLNDYGPSGERWYPPAGIIADETTIRLDVSDPIQQALDYDLLSDTGGWLIFCISGVNVTVNNLGWEFGDDPVVVANPCLTVTTTNIRGEKHWGNGVLPVVLDFDDNSVSPDPGGYNQFDYFAAMRDSGLTFTSVAYGDGMANSNWDTFNTNHDGEIEYVAHSYDHSYIGVDYLDGDVQLPRSIFIDALTTDPDTNVILDFAWTGGAVADSQYGLVGMNALVNYNYRSSRASLVTWDDDSGQTTRLSWEHPVNLYQFRSDYGWSGSLNSANSTAEITDYIKDAIDLNYTRYGKAALMLFTHDYARNGITLDNLRHLISLVNSMNCVEWRTHSEVIEMRKWNVAVPTTLIGSPEVMSGSPDSAAIYASAVLHETARVDDGLTRLAEVWSLGRDYYLDESVVHPNLPYRPQAFGAGTSTLMTVDQKINDPLSRDVVHWTAYRAEAEGGPYVDIGDFPLNGDVSGGFYLHYAFDDSAVVNGTQYWYKYTFTNVYGNESAKTAAVSSIPSAASNTSVVDVNTATDTNPPSCNSIDAVCEDIDQQSFHLDFSEPVEFRFRTLVDPTKAARPVYINPNWSAWTPWISTGGSTVYDSGLLGITTPGLSFFHIEVEYRDAACNWGVSAWDYYGAAADGGCP